MFILRILPHFLPRTVSAASGNYNLDPRPLRRLVNLLAILACLLAQHTYPVKGRAPLTAFYGRVALSAAKRLNAGDRNSGVLAWAALMGAVLVPVIGRGAGGAIHPVVVVAPRPRGSLLDAALPATTCDPRGHRAKALREQNVAAAARRLGAMAGRAGPDRRRGGHGAPGCGARRCARRTTARSAHSSGSSSCPGPSGSSLYPLALRAAQSWEHLGWTPRSAISAGSPARAFQVIDWIPQRVSAFVFAVVGNFEDALFCWRSQAAHVAASRGGHRARERRGRARRAPRRADRRCGEAFVERPTLGTGELAREDALASLEGLLWRSLILWLIVFAARCRAARFPERHHPDRLESHGTRLRPLLPLRRPHRDPSRDSPTRNPGLFRSRASARATKAATSGSSPPPRPRRQPRPTSPRSGSTATSMRPSSPRPPRAVHYLHTLEERIRQGRRHDAPARHACALHLPAHQSRRRRMGSRRQAEVHPLFDAAPIRSTRSRSTASTSRTWTATGAS